MLHRLDKLIEAIENHDCFATEDLLSQDLCSVTKIPVKYLAGALVIAAESNSIACFNKMVEYNAKLTNPIPQKYIQAAYSIVNSVNHYKEPLVLENTIH